MRMQLGGLLYKFSIDRVFYLSFNGNGDGFRHLVRDHLTDTFEGVSFSFEGIFFAFVLTDLLNDLGVQVVGLANAGSFVFNAMLATIAFRLKVFSGFPRGLRRGLRRGPYTGPGSPQLETSMATAWMM